jgi:2-amino-4-hydroxy-6-hydroxymethyldihydropteridine diphosphokinase
MCMNESAAHRVVLSIGSNSQRELHFTRAFDELHQRFGDLVFSPIYENQSTHDSSFNSGNYYNAVVSFYTHKGVAELQSMVHDIEARCGRDRTQMLVNMDIDLLLYGDSVGEIDRVTLPHKDILQRAYILRPLADSLPDLLYPLTDRPFHVLWESFCDDSEGLPLLEPVDFVLQGRVISVASPCFII